MLRRLLYIAIALLAAVVPASAQLRFGVKGGIAVNKLHFNKDVLSTDNRAGFAGGVQLEFGLPVTGLALEGSLMYSHRNDAFSDSQQTYRRDFIEIPVHVKYGLTILGLNRVLVPYAFTGPNFSFLFNETEQDLWDNRASNTSWDVGFGVELLNHLQLQASYAIGLTKAFKQVGLEHLSEEINGRDHCWTITAAYLF